MGEWLRVAVEVGIFGVLVGVRVSVAGIDVGRPTDPGSGGVARPNWQAITPTISSTTSHPVPRFIHTPFFTQLCYIIA